MYFTKYMHGIYSNIAINIHIAGMFCTLTHWIWPTPLSITPTDPGGVSTESVATGTGVGGYCSHWSAVSWPTTVGDFTISQWGQVSTSTWSEVLAGLTNQMYIGRLYTLSYNYILTLTYWRVSTPPFIYSTGTCSVSTTENVATETNIKRYCTHWSRRGCITVNNHSIGWWLQIRAGDCIARW